MDAVRTNFIERQGVISSRNNATPLFAVKGEELNNIKTSLQVLALQREGNMFSLDAGRRKYGNQPRRPWQNSVHDGLLAVVLFQDPLDLHLDFCSKDLNKQLSDEFTDMLLGEAKEEGLSEASGELNSAFLSVPKDDYGKSSITSQSSKPWPLVPPGFKRSILKKSSTSIPIYSTDKRSRSSSISSRPRSESSPTPASRDPDAFAYAIERSCENKAEVVSQDEKENGLRATLNLGHKSGHFYLKAIETSYGYGYWLHDEAVTAGTVMVVDMSYRLGWIDNSIMEKTNSILKLAKLPTAPPEMMIVDMFKSVMAVDKNVVDGLLRLVLLKGPLGSRVFTRDYDRKALDETLNALCKS
ncbi:3-dehydroquinate synthase, chloroplastic [Tanacetum coccineum]